MHERYRCGTLRRRQFLGSAAAASALPAIIGTYVSTQAAAAAAQVGAGAKDAASGLGVPGPYPGRVIEVRKPDMAISGKRNQAAVGQALSKGLAALTGADDGVSAWRTFVEPGDVVGIKVVPNGHPNAPTSPELILEVIAGLKAAGIPYKDMILFDRYKGEFLTAGYDKIVPQGVNLGWLTTQGDQLEMTFADDPTAGYDRDEFVNMELVHYGSDPKDDRNFRSHLGLLVTKRVNKIICLPVLKDHGSAGVTGALKNMSHGLVNNVARSHSTPGTNACNQFIPTVASHPIIRQKCVLQIMDGTRGIWQGGPFGRKNEWSWDYNGLLFATDPVAMDHVEWDIVDAKRKEMGAPGVAAVGKLAADPFQTEGFDVRQPQHIALAGNVGLGYFEYRSPRGRRFSINHEVVQMKPTT